MSGEGERYKLLELQLEGLLWERNILQQKITRIRDTMRRIMQRERKGELTSNKVA